jgi:soluble P-type ATPase
VIEIDIPGFATLELTDLVCDYNGTLALDGALLGAARARLPRLTEHLRLHVVTGDTFGTARDELAGLSCEVVVLPKDDQAEAKARFAESLGARHVAAIGNGRNDRLLVATAGLGIGVIGGEGIAAETISACDVVAPDIGAALDLLLETKRLVASLRG